ncbi:hypothetical protein GCM10007931_19750 [Vibrio algivorus]|uniref:Uncharacterized protein n=1 Tax=Vibrio algivorus TaxID=1667024 RepID=A0ABQ6EQU6_9VIBR|nr:hypothetical protein GCM10007931_19750 [Vibrio algivorus]
MDYQLIDELARAVADDSYLVHPRRWLSEHDIPSIFLTGLPNDCPHKILIDDYRAMNTEARRLLKN